MDVRIPVLGNLLNSLFRGRGTQMKKIRKRFHKGGPAGQSNVEVISDHEMYERQIKWSIQHGSRLDRSLMYKAEEIGLDVPERLRPKGWS